MNYLVVVAHPDDEVLGAGATIYKLAKEGNTVNVCILSGDVNARTNRPGLNELNNNINSSLNFLGVEKVIKGNFPNIEFNTVPHLHLVQFIEKVISDTFANVIFTHHPADLNNDHFHTSLACQAAVRLFQRRKEITPIKEFLFMEILSSTDWSLNKTIQPFSPNTFVEIEEEGISKKIEALSLYEGVMRKYPHPRSCEALKALAIFRGAQAGMVYAEAFESVFRRGF